ncbi:MAG: D-alanyl-D-alanine carboxypeptidase [Treponema sp.]|nr:D-alanyl-D-alanine carboxypeptidase [Treponema sp.]
MEKITRTNKIIFLTAASTLLVIACVFSFANYISDFYHPERLASPTSEQQEYLTEYLNQTYPSKRVNVLRGLPYSTVDAQLDVSAESAILVDTANGCILYEKNADEAIPPASITKLFVMYIVFQEVESGRISLDNVVPLPESSWAINLPSDASLMFLGQGQIVTLRELMQGLAIASGNDAAIAVATYVSGSVKNFVARMNEEVQKLGLKYTHFEEPSGYSEKNITTARELATFARVYINRYPQAIEEFHSLKEIEYPKKENLAPWMKNRGNSMAVKQWNTNVLLRSLEGCDGLKTGFIYESGFNIALTAKRNGVRYLSVTMRGPGRNSREGNQYRQKDGTTLMEWAFSSFSDYIPLEHIAPSYTVAVTGAEGKFVRLVPAWTNIISVPHIVGDTAADAAKQVRVEITRPNFIYGGTLAGENYGQITYSLGSVVLETVPLVADRTIERAGVWGRFWGIIASRFIKH